MKNNHPDAIRRIDVSDVFPDLIDPTMHVHPQHQKSVLSFKSNTGREMAASVDVEKFYGLLEKMRTAQRA